MSSRTHEEKLAEIAGILEWEKCNCDTNKDGLCVTCLVAAVLKGTHDSKYKTRRDKIIQLAEEHDQYASKSDDSERTVTWAEMHREIAFALRKLL